MKSPQTLFRFPSVLAFWFLSLLSCRSASSATVADIRSELLSTRNIEGYPGCMSFWSYHTIVSLGCDAVGPLLALLDDSTLVPNFGLFNQYRTEVGDLAFFTLAEMDPKLWREVAYADGREGVLEFTRFSQGSRAEFARIVKARGIRCPEGGIKSRAPDKMCPEDRCRAAEAATSSVTK